MSGITAAVFAMAERGHFKRMLPIIDGLARAGVTTYVFTAAAFEHEVARAGGRFIDLFADHTVEDADGTSIPVPSRFVSFAGTFGGEVARTAATLGPSLVVHDSFAVVGQVVAHHLGVPRVNVCAGHNLAPAPTLEALGRDPRVRLSDACWSAVERLKLRHGMPDASPFSYVSAVSPDLNLYREPPQFLRSDERDAFEPVAFFGSLWPEGEGRERPADSMFGGDLHTRLRVYASFGTVIWRYHEDVALAALEALSRALGGRTDAEAIISLGGVGPIARAASLASRNVRIERYVDQWAVLSEASLYFTHQALNSTHEAIYHEVPMLFVPLLHGPAGPCRALPGPGSRRSGRADAAGRGDHQRCAGCPGSNGGHTRRPGEPSGGCANVGARYHPRTARSDRPDGGAGSMNQLVARRATVAGRR